MESVSHFIPENTARNLSRNGVAFMASHDPDELINLAGRKDMADVIRSMRQLMQGWRKDLADPADEFWGALPG